MGIFDGIKKMFSGFSMIGNQRYFHDQLGLNADEDFKTMTMGTLWQEPSKAENAKAAVLGVVGLFTGHTVEQTGLQAAFGITTTGRLVVGMVEGMDDPLSFNPQEGYRLEDTGLTSEKKVMGPKGRTEEGKILSLQGPSGEVFQLIIAASNAGGFISWPQQ